MAKEPKMIDVSRKEIEDQIKAHQEHIDRLRKKLHEKNQQEARDNRSIYKRKKELDKLRGRWAKENLRVGDIIKVQGSRNTAPRRILESGPQLLVTTVRWDRHKQEFVNTFTVTNHMFDKATKIYRDGKFIDIKDLLDT